MGSSFISWQAQLALVALVVGGGYIAFVNKMPPFNKGGLFDQFTNLFPKADKDSDGISDDDEAPGMGGGLPMPTTPIPNPPGMPGQPPGLAMSPFQGPTGSPQSTPTGQAETVYENYAKALNFLYGQGNQANVSGNPNIPFVGGDPNLGTTPVPSGLVNPVGSGAAPPPGMPIYPGGPAASGMMQGGQQQLQFPGPTRLPTQPFLPNPMQFPGQIQPGPYPASPPRMPGMPPIPAPPIYIDLGEFDPTFRGIRLQHLIQIGVPLIEIFPHGPDWKDIKKLKKDIRNYLHKIMSRVHNGFRGSIWDIIKDESKRWKKHHPSSSSDVGISMPGLSIGTGGINIGSIPGLGSTTTTSGSFIPGVGSMGNIPNIQGMFAGTPLATMFSGAARQVIVQPSDDDDDDDDTYGPSFRNNNHVISRISNPI